MKRINNWLLWLIFPLLVIHGLWGSFLLLGFHVPIIKSVSYVLTLAVVLHGLIGLLMTRDAISIGLQTGHWYWKENARFWVIRLSGICIFVLLGFHACVYGKTVNGVFTLNEFTFLRMLSQLLFLLAILVHLVAAARPWLISLGIVNFGRRAWDCIVVSAILTAFFTFAVISYYIDGVF